jgi:HSP20 family protein
VPWKERTHDADADAYRRGEQFVVHFDLPGVDPSSIDLHVERNVLTVKAERTPTYGEDVELQVAERPRGVFTRQLFLGDTLDADRIEAHYCRIGGCHARRPAPPMPYSN